MIKIIQDSHDMLYYISMLSTTGGKLKVAPKKILKRYNQIKNLNKNKNIVIGFGITEKTIGSLKKLMDWWLVVLYVKKSQNLLKRDKILSQM